MTDPPYGVDYGPNWRKKAWPSIGGKIGAHRKPARFKTMSTLASCYALVEVPFLG
jgi:hypothetical protein